MITASKMFAPSKLFAPSNMFKRAWTAGGVVAETIQQLLQRNNGSGWWLGDSLAGLYQNSDLTTPVTAAGQVVGFMPDNLATYAVTQTIARDTTIVASGNGYRATWSQDGSGVITTVNRDSSGAIWDLGNAPGFTAGQIIPEGKRFRVTFTAWKSANSGNVNSYFQQLASPYASYFIRSLTTTPTTYVVEDVKRLSGNVQLTLPVANTVSGELAYTYLSELKIEVLEGSPAIQSTTASKPLVEQLVNGTYAISYNGTSNFLTTSCTAGGATNFTLTVAGFSTGLNKVAAGCMSAVAESRAYIGVNNSGNAGAGATTITFDTLASNQAWSSYHVVTLRRSGALLELFVDGVLADTETGTLTGTDLAMYLGALNNNGTAANFWQGNIAFTSGCLAVVNDADRLAIERYAGSLVGITI